MATNKQLLSDGEAALAGSDSARLDAELLLAFAVENTRTWLYTWPEHVPAVPQQNLYLELIRRRQAGEPVAYITGRREFWGLELKVDSRVLIPRPETETLVEAVLDKLAAMEVAHVADLGTGSGAIALALASEKPQWSLVATDKDAEALALARENAQQLAINSVEFVHGNWCVPLAGQDFDAIVSNPPYIAEADPHLTRGDVRFEPEHALVSGEKGLADIRHLATDCTGCLKSGGWLIVEHGFDQGDAVRQIFSEAGFAGIESMQDLAGHERVTAGRMQG